MKKLLIVLAIAGTLTACSNNRPPDDDEDFIWNGQPKDTVLIAKLKVCN